MKQKEHWTTEKWVIARVKEIHKAMADINRTLSNGDDPSLMTCYNLERVALQNYMRAVPLPVPDVSDYIPKNVDIIWVQNRMRILHAKRSDLSNYLNIVGPDLYIGCENSLAATISKQIGDYGHGSIKGYEEMVQSGGWTGPMAAFEEYVKSLEYIQALLRSANAHNNRCFTGKMVYRFQGNLLTLHTRALEQVQERNLMISIRPWLKMDDLRGTGWMTMEEYESAPLESWEEDGAGPPAIEDESVAQLCRAVDLEDLSISRREDLDTMLEKYRGKRYSVARRYIGWERKLWGRLQMAITQMKRHGTWEDMCHPSKEAQVRAVWDAAHLPASFNKEEGK